jgi:hypothetical protein
MRGVIRKGKKFVACASKNYLGTFDTMKEAALARDDFLYSTGARFIANFPRGPRDQIELTHGKVALIDEWNFDRVYFFGLWHYEDETGVNDVGRGRDRVRTRLPQFIVGAGKGEHVYARDENPLNCREANLSLSSLRAVMESSNPDWPGVYPFKNRWAVKVDYQGKKLYLGKYGCKKQAAAVYDQFVTEHFLDPVTNKSLGNL